MIRYCSTFTAPNTNITNMIKHYVQLSDSVICKLPTMKLNVNGKTLKFVVDTGATYSVIRKHDLPHTDMSSRSLHSMGASGVSTRETFSLPLNCRLGDHGFKHSFLMSSSCPLNLMGRDLILGLGVNLVSTPEGLELRRPDAQSITMLAKPVTQDTLWIYVWSINEQSAQQMLLSAKEKLIPTAHMQQVDAVHCTARVTEHRDNAYEEQFYAQASVDLMTAKMYWNSTRCPVSVSLCKPECDLFDVLSSVPHVSLARSHKDEWKHIGQWTRLCEEATDWEQTLDPKVLFSPSLQVYSTDWYTAVPATPTVLMIQESTIQTLVSQPTPHEPELFTVPDCVWAAHKYDVGLIRNCEPLVVTPKSTHRPRRAQYPLRKEAIEGIQPVFDSLLAAGVIVPCPNSPILPVKKYRPPPEPEEWRSLQCLLQRSSSPRLPILVCLSVPGKGLHIHSNATRLLTPCVQDTVTLLTHLVKEGHKVSRTKMQYAQQIVTFLGHKISRDQRTLHTLPQPDHLSM
ncbi:uncharacterized protein LOC130535469 isoform X1 [Takifugu flavidus]|uniref:uncharacterized protein LOC130535469 isoform X1 n=1 Tax=Takifugu flavidus TaxID=433684 RepID=UPI002544A1B3|nr:uncharacterized protein LOC130535469 isoform X1 [Takifugu flavidus]